MHDFLTPISPDALLARSRDEIEAIQTAAGFTEVHFNLFFRPLLVAYANRVQQLPLTPTVYARSHGAWDFGLVVSLLTLRVASTRMFFPDVDSEARRRLEPQCRFAAFAAGLATGVALVAENAYLSDDAGDEYHPLASAKPLHDWLRTSSNPTFEWIRPEAPLSGPECAAIAARFLPPAVLKDFDLRIALMIFNSINPKSSMSGVETTLSTVVRLSTEKTFEAYLEEDKTTYQTPIAGAAGAVPTLTQVNRAVDRMIRSTQPPTNEPDNILPQAATPAPAPTSPNAPAAPPAASGDKAGPGILANAHPVLVEWFKALKKHDRYPELRDKLVVTEDGIEMPGQMLGMFGVNGATVKKYMDEAQLLTGRAANIRNILLAKDLHPYLFEDAK